MEGGGVRITLVDDDVIVREAIAMALRTHGFEVTVVDDLDPEHLVEATASADPRVVLLDHHLGTGKGADLVRPIVQATGATVLLLTGSDDPEIHGASLEAGAAGTLLKRQPLQDLLEAIALAADGHSPQRPEQRDQLIAEGREARTAREAALEPFGQLSKREASVLGGMVDGLSAEQIAERDYVSLPTVRSQIQSILRKLGVSSQLAAVAAARRAGWQMEDT